MNGDSRRGVLTTSEGGGDLGQAIDQYSHQMFCGLLTHIDCFDIIRATIRGKDYGICQNYEITVV